MAYIITVYNKKFLKNHIIITILLFIARPQNRKS